MILVTLWYGVQCSNIATKRPEKRPAGDENYNAALLVGLVETTEIDNHAIFLDY